MSKGLLLAIADELDRIEHGFDNSTLEVVATLIAQDPGKEGEHRGVLGREFEAKRTNGVNNDDFELVTDLESEKHLLVF